MKHFIKRVSASAAVVLLPGVASAQAWAPTKPITFVVPVAPGSSNDMIARMLSELMQRMGICAMARGHAQVLCDRIALQLGERAMPPS